MSTYTTLYVFLMPPRQRLFGDPLGALNKISHIPECQAAQERIIERAQSSPWLVRARQQLCAEQVWKENKLWHMSFTEVAHDYNDFAYEFHRLCI